MPQLHGVHIGEPKHFFDAMDTDNSGLVDGSELRLAFKELDIVLTEEEENEMFALFDVDDSGKVSYAEFLKEARWPPPFHTVLHLC
eukprot:SAG31_NODE_19545_length_599_cov_0.850000_1_plen_85_part_10